MLEAYLTYGKQNKDKINTKLHVFNKKKLVMENLYRHL